MEVLSESSQNSDISLDTDGDLSSTSESAPPIPDVRTSALREESSDSAQRGSDSSISQNDLEEKATVVTLSK